MKHDRTVTAPNKDLAEFCQSKGMSTSGAKRFKTGVDSNVFNPASGRVWFKGPEGAREDAMAATDTPAAARSNWVARLALVGRLHYCNPKADRGTRRPEILF